MASWSSNPGPGPDRLVERGWPIEGRVTFLLSVGFLGGCLVGVAWLLWRGA